MPTRRWPLFLAAGALLCIAAVSRGAAGASVVPPAQQSSGGDGGLISRGHIEVRDLPVAGLREAVPDVAKARRIARPASGLPPPTANAKDSSVAGTAPLLTSRQIDGIDSGDINDAFVFDLTPPDTQIAVGEDHIFEMVNSLGRIFDKDGAELASFPLTDFFGTPDGYQDTDPRVLYDASTERWFAAYMAYDDSLIGTDRGELEFAVSDSSNPMGGWETYFRTFDETLPDYPSLGITDDKVTLSFNLYDIDAPPGPPAAGCSPKDGFCGAQTVVLQKSDLLATEDVVTTTELDVEADRYSVRAARSLSSVNDQYLASWSTTAANQIVIMRITGTPEAGNVTEVSADSLTTLSQDTPPRSKTAGTGNCVITQDGEDQTFPPPPCIDSGDGGMLDAVWRDDLLWTSATAACTPAGDSTVRACAHLVAIDTDGTPSIEQDIMFGSAGDYYSWPAVTTDVDNNLFVSLTRTRASIFAEARGTGRQADDPPNTMTGSVLLRAGDVEHNSGRWGDYMGAATDPENSTCVWLAGEYAKVSGGSSWGTYIAALSYDDSCGEPASSPTPTATATVPSPTATVPDDTNTPPSTPSPGSTPTHTPPSGSTPTRTRTPMNTPAPDGAPGDVNCDGRVNSLDALALLQFSAELLEEVGCPENADVNDDGVINSLDAALVLQYGAGLIVSLPAGGLAGEVPTIRVGSLDKAIDEVGGAYLQARNIPLTGLGAWTIDVAYNGDIVAPVACGGLSGGICNASYDANVMRAVGATGSSGLTGNRDLAVLSFRCIAEGVSALHVTLRVLVDGSSGEPQPINAAIEDGSITCTNEPATPGDVNCDGEVNAIDAALILQLTAGLIDSSIPCEESADVDGDGSITAIDAALVLQYVAGLIPSL